MTRAARTVEPFGFFTLESLRAGWYLAWRLVLFTLPFTLVPVVLAGLVGAWGLWLAAALLVLGGIVLGVAAAIGITNRVAGAWALREHGRPLLAGVWWSITWRVLLVSLPLGLLLTPLGLFAQGPLFIGSVLDLILPVVGLALAGVFVVATVQAYGWAMSTAVADRLGPAAGLEEPDDLDEPAPHRSRFLVPRPPGPARAAAPARPAAAAPRQRRERSAEEPGTAVATAPASANSTSARANPAPASPAPAATMQCPKCGLREMEQGAVIGWYCRVCGWRARRG